MSPPEVILLSPLACRYDLLHHTADSQRLYPAASFARPRYVAPPPPAPADKKEGKGDSGKADGKAAGKGGDKAAPAAPAASSSGGKAGAGSGKGAAAAAAAAGGDAAAAGGKKGKGKGEDGKGKGGAPATPAASGEAAPKKDDDCTVDLLDIRVGQIVKVGCWVQPAGRVGGGVGCVGACARCVSGRDQQWHSCAQGRWQEGCQRGRREGGTPVEAGACGWPGRLGSCETAVLAAPRGKKPLVQGVVSDSRPAALPPSHTPVRAHLKCCRWGATPTPTHFTWRRSILGRSSRGRWAPCSHTRATPHT